MGFSWANIFNTTHRHYGHVSVAYEACRNSGYRYMSWNGKVYDTDSVLFNEEAVVCEVGDVV